MQHRIMGVPIRDLVHRGWTVTRCNNGHWKLVHAKGIVFCSHSASDKRAYKNFMRDIRNVERRES